VYVAEVEERLEKEPQALSEQEGPEADQRTPRWRVSLVREAVKICGWERVKLPRTGERATLI